MAPLIFKWLIIFSAQAEGVSASNITRQAMSIILSQNGRNARRPTPQPSQYESFVRQFIYDTPDVLPLDDYRGGVKLTVLAREFPTRSGPIDAIAIDQQGELYLIESKLYRNPDKRHGVAQVLNYGASLSSGLGDPAIQSSNLTDPLVP
jgi:RecB family endonuclease NucS